MKILFAYDGSTEADAAIVRAAALFGHHDAEAVVLSVWEPLTVQALRAERFGSPSLAVPFDAADADERTSHQPQRLAEHGARLAGEAGIDARAVSVADNRIAASPGSLHFSAVSRPTSHNTPAGRC
jgi:nucleotide-binding universal stress UspA family protein